jgi:hypothetical protein
MFAAYVWFTSRKGEDAQTLKEAAAFARENWEAFLPCAHVGLGRLLYRIAGVKKRVGRRRGRTGVPSPDNCGPTGGSADR